MLRCAALSLSLVLSTPALALAQQVASTAPGASSSGHRLFVQSCAVCHLKPSPVAETYGPALSKETVEGREGDVRDFIRTGSERMPGFRYSLDAAEIDAIIAYLATVPPPPAAPAKPAATRQGEMPR